MVTEENPSQDHIGIVTECLNIWTSFITYNSHLLEGLYENGAQFVRILIDQGLMGINSEMRIEFKEALLFVSLNVNNSQLTQPPSNFFLQVLLSKLPLVVQTTNPKNTKQYFQLLHTLTESYFDHPTSLFNEKILLHQVLDFLFQY